MRKKAEAKEIKKITTEQSTYNILILLHPRKVADQTVMQLISIMGSMNTTINVYNDMFSVNTLYHPFFT